MERISHTINVYGMTAHNFRHTFATMAYRHGMSDKTLQSIMGHSDIKTTHIYTHTQTEDVMAAEDIMSDMFAVS